MSGLTRVYRKGSVGPYSDRKLNFPVCALPGSDGKMHEWAWWGPWWQARGCYLHISDIHLQNGSHGQPGQTRALTGSQGSHGQSWAVMGRFQRKLFPSWAALDSHGKNFLWNPYISGVQSWTVTGRTSSGTFP